MLFNLIKIGIISSAVFFMLRQAGLPNLNGKKYMEGLTHPVVIHRDENGVPRIKAQNRIDTTWSLGFLHGQERFFQMDLLRRAAAGELAEILGKGALSMDQENRPHNFRERAKNIFNNLPPYEQNLLKAYTAGVNSGVKALFMRPFEYVVCKSAPRPWQVEDSILVGFAMYLDLQGQNAQGAPNLFRWLVLRTCGSSIYQFLFKNRSQWEAALDKSVPPLVPLPDPAAFNYKVNKPSNNPINASHLKEETPTGASNHWALSGKFTKDGSAILASDPHLTLGVPNIWYHVAFTYNDKEETINLVGATLPGVPAIILGSNGYVSWGLTNASLDTSDVILLEEGAKTWKRKECIKVKGGPNVIMEIEESQWGPLLPGHYLNQRCAIKWVAYDLQAYNLGFNALEKVKDVHAAIAASRNIKGPIQNILFADKIGNIGWTLAGTLPKRINETGELPISSKSMDAAAFGIQDPQRYPTIVNPPEGFLFTANNRIVDPLIWEPIIGHGAYANPIRAYQIRESLSNLTTASETTMLALQLSDRAIFLERWHKLMLSLIENNQDPLYKILQSWDKHASSGSKAYPLIRAFRQEVMKLFVGKILSPVWKENPAICFHYDDFEEPIWKIIHSDIGNLLSQERESCKAQLRHILYVINKQYLSKGYPTWGELNLITIRHPFSSGAPFLSKLVDMPSFYGSGDNIVPKVLINSRTNLPLDLLNSCFVKKQGRIFGASLRMVVRPGKESEGIYQTPTGQSSYPLSKFYRKGHKEWATGKPFPLAFKENSIVSKLVLLPAKNNNRPKSFGLN